MSYQFKVFKTSGQRVKTLGDFLLSVKEQPGAQSIPRLRKVREETHYKGVLCRHPTLMQASVAGFEPVTYTSQRHNFTVTARLPCTDHYNTNKTTKLFFVSLTELCGNCSKNTNYQNIKCCFISIYLHKMMTDLMMEIRGISMSEYLKSQLLRWEERV